MIVTLAPSRSIEVLALVGLFILYFLDLINRTFGNRTQLNFSYYYLLAPHAVLLPPFWVPKDSLKSGGFTFNLSGTYWR